MAGIAILWWRSMLCNKPKAIIFKQRKVAELGVTNTYRVLQHRLKHWLQIAG